MKLDKFWQHPVSFQFVALMGIIHSISLIFSEVSSLIHSELSRSELQNKPVS